MSGIGGHTVPFSRVVSMRASIAELHAGVEHDAGRDGNEQAWLEEAAWLRDIAVLFEDNTSPDGIADWEKIFLLGKENERLTTELAKALNRPPWVKLCAYPDGDHECDPALCPPECFPRRLAFTVAEKADIQRYIEQDSMTEAFDLIHNVIFRGLS